MTECHILPFYTAKNGRADELPALDLNSHEMVFRGTLLVKTELKATNAYINGKQMVNVVLWRPKFAQSVLEKELEVIDEYTAMVDTKCKKTGTRCKDLRELFETKRK